MSNPDERDRPASTFTDADVVLNSMPITTGTPLNS